MTIRNAWPAVLGLVFLALGAAPAVASAVSFDKTWKEQRFSLFSSNDFGLFGDALKVGSDGTVSLVWTKLASDFRNARMASWNWQVNEGVPPTDLTAKGGDDRNLSLYFIFLPEEVAETARGGDVMDLLDRPDVRILMYVWGGNHPQGAILPTPYLGERGRTIVRQPAGTGSTSDTVDLGKDHLAAFGEAAKSLVGLAVSADSDDTGTHIDATISRLRLSP
jgi:hypothetical protein